MTLEVKKEDQSVSHRAAAAAMLAAAGIAIARDASADIFDAMTELTTVRYLDLISGQTKSVSWAEEHMKTDPNYAILRKVKVPFGWNGKVMVDAFSGKLTSGKRPLGLSYPGPKGRPVAYFVFDTQGENSIRMIERLKPLLNDIDIQFFPVPYLNWRSGPQAAQILTAKEPWRVLERHILRFNDPETRGIAVNRNYPFADAVNLVWLNGKMYRYSGGRDVPFGVYQIGPNRYVPFDASLSSEELRTILRKYDSLYYPPRK